MAVKIGDRFVTTQNEIDALTQAAYDKADAPPRRLYNQSWPPNMTATLQEWLRSNPWDFAKVGSVVKLGTFRTTFGLANNQPKAYWKQFKNREECYEHLTYESDARVIRNKGYEVKYGNEVLQHQATANVLNDLRRALGRYFWSNDSTLGKASHLVATHTPLNLLPNLSGSYNEANSYPDYERTATEAGYDPISIIRSWIIRPFLDYGLSHRDRFGLMFDERNFTVAENIAILHDIKELFSPRGNSRFLVTAHSELIPHPYQGAHSPNRPQRWKDDGRSRTDVLLRTLQPYEGGSLRGQRSEVKWDQGRNGAGTRNEKSPDTQTARKTYMPIETGRSHTAARLFEMVCLLHPTKEGDLFKSRLRAMAFGIFGYWNGAETNGGYPKSLTPVHTYHEVMDPAEDYLPGVYSSPFDYENVKDYLSGRA